MTTPAFVPFAAVTAALVAGSGAVSAAPASGQRPQSPIAAHPVSHPRLAIVPPKVLAAGPGASVARGPGAGTTGLAASSVAAAATSGVGRSVRDFGRVTGRPPAGSARIRAPPA
jgi:hypothetical protein